MLERLGWRSGTSLRLSHRQRCLRWVDREGASLAAALERRGLDDIILSLHCRCHSSADSLGWEVRRLLLAATILASLAFMWGDCKYKIARHERHITIFMRKQAFMAANIPW